MMNLSTRSLLFAGVLSLSLGASSAMSSGQTKHPGEHPPAPQKAQVHQHDHEHVVPAPIEQAPAEDAPLIQVALLLDTSNSMDGLIDQAKAQLWMIVNRFAKAQRDGQQPRFQIALFEYGNTNLPAEEGYIRQVVSFTNDLDALSEALFSLKTRGGDEYCAQVIDEALTRLDWSPKGNDFKAIYIAGNEPFTQGRIDYVGVCKRAQDKGVLINTIHCGDQNAGISGKWQHAAQLAGGSFLTINQDRKFIHRQAPQDIHLGKLNAELNRTYLAYGEEGEALQERQEQLDTDNAGLSADAGAQRAASKASGLYFNGNWDLIDASKAKDFDLAKLPADQLPEAMREMTLGDKRAYIEKMAKERAEIQSQINRLARERAEHVAAERARRADAEGESLGEAVESTIDDQLEAEGFEIKEDVSTDEGKEPSKPETKAEEKPAE